MLNISCKKKKSVEPAPAPVKEFKRCYAKVIFKQDSLVTFYIPHQIQVIVFDKSPSDPTFNIVTNKVSSNSNSFATGSTYTTFTVPVDLNLLSYNVDKPFTYWIMVSVGLESVDGLHDRYNQTVKQYTFNEGENGTINFKTIP